MSVESELTAVSKKYFDPTIRQQAYQDSVFFKTLQSKNKVIDDGGSSIQVPIRYRKLGNAEASAPRAQMVFESKTTRTWIDLAWKYYTVKTMLHWDEKIKNAGKGKIIDLAKDKAAELKEDLNDVLQTALFATSQGTYDFVPLSTIVDSSATYGGLAVSDASEWASNEDSSTTTLILSGSGSLGYMVDASTFGRFEPTLHITTRSLRTKYESLLTPNNIYEDKATANLGFPNITFRKKPNIGDAYCPAGYWYGLDMNQFEAHVHKDDNMYISDWFKLEQAGFPKALAKYATWVGNIVCRMRKTSFKFSALDYTK